MNFVELRKGEVRRIPLLRTRVNKGRKKGQNVGVSWPSRGRCELLARAANKLVFRIIVNCDGPIRLARIRARAKEYGVGFSVGCFDRLVVAGADVEGVFSGAADDGVGAPLAAQAVLAVITVDGVVAVATVDRVLALAAPENILTVAAVDGVLTLVAVHGIIAGTASEGIVAAQATYLVGLGGAPERIGAVGALLLGDRQGHPVDHDQRDGHHRQQKGDPSHPSLLFSGRVGTSLTYVRISAYSPNEAGASSKQTTWVRQPVNFRELRQCEVRRISLQRARGNSVGCPQSVFREMTQVRRRWRCSSRWLRWMISTRC